MDEALSRLNTIIKLSKIDRELIYSTLGVTNGGFYYKLNHGTFTLLDFVKISSILDVFPDKLIKIILDNTIDLDKSILGANKKESEVIGSDAVEIPDFELSAKEVHNLDKNDLLKENLFLRIQLDRTTQILQNLTGK